MSGARVAWELEAAEDPDVRPLLTVCFSSILVKTDRASVRHGEGPPR